MQNRTMNGGSLKGRVMALAVASFFLLSGAAFAGPDLAGRGGAYVPGELLVKYRGSAAQPSLSLLPEGVEVKGRYAKGRIHHLRLPEGISVDEVLRRLSADPFVAYAEPNYLRFPAATLPSDPLFGELWALRNTGQTVNGTSGTAGADIAAVGAWDIVTGSKAVVVALVDSGVDYNHPDLAGNLLAGYDVVDADAFPMDSNGHGTHVAGTIGAVGNNGLGTAGVSWAASILPVRAAGAFGTLTVADIVSAVDYAVSRGARVINASYRGYDYSQAEYEAIAAARRAGVLMVAAAGNEGNDNDKRPVYPAGYCHRIEGFSYPTGYEGPLDNIIAVAATDQNDGLASFSNYGAKSVHVAAPGVNILSARPGRRTFWGTDFDSDTTGWTTGGEGSTWGLTAKPRSGAYSLGFTAGGTYPASVDSWAQAPAIDLSTAMGSRLVFWFTGRSEASKDLLYVETSRDGVTWKNQDVYVVSSAGSFVGIFRAGISGSGSDQWYGAVVDLGEYDGSPSLRLRFRFVAKASDDATAYEGWFIDDMALGAAASEYSGSEYRYLSGTSMATPHVSGLAALLWSFKPDLTYGQVKEIIIGSSDPRETLKERVLSGGRINALAALYRVVPAAPAGLVAALTETGGVALSWLDASKNETGFRIERRQGDGGYALVATVGQDSAAFAEGGLSAGAVYCYRVASFNSGGLSPYSNEACVTTAAPPSPPTPEGGGGGGGCFIATAAFGSSLAGQVQLLRAFRDAYLLKCGPGREFVAWYYRTSPPLAGVVAKSAWLKALTRLALLPLIAVAWAALHLGQAAVLLTAVLLLLFLVRLFPRRGAE